MIQKVVNPNDIEITAKLAHKIWNQHYVAIIGQNRLIICLINFRVSKQYNLK